MNNLIWRGDEVKKKAERAARLGMDETLMRCVAGGKRRVPVKTALLQGSIQMRPTEKKGNWLIGLWGSWNVNYAAAVELGAKPHIITPKNKKALFWPGADHPVKIVHHPGTAGKPFLRPTADEEYPKLKGRIAKYFG